MKTIKKGVAFILVLVMIMSIVGCNNNSGPRTATATRQGMGGDIKVTLTVDNGKIIKAVIVGDKETPGIGQRAVKEMPAKLVAKGSVDIDGISGATVSSSAILGAARMAYDSAMGVKSEIGAVKMKPGTYTASAMGYWGLIPLPVTITVNETSLLSIKVPESRREHSETEVILQSVKDKLFPRMIENQSVAINAITGATITSNAVKVATEAALAKALKAGGSEPSAIEHFYVTPKEPKTAVKEMNVDVLVVGMSSSGILAMKSAQETLMAINGGNRVCVFGIDKAGKYGGQSAMTHEMNAVNPKKYQAQFNNGKDLMDAEAYRKVWLDYTKDENGKQRAKEDLVNLFINESGNALDWLIYDQGYQFGTIKKQTDFSNTNFNAMYNYFASNNIDKYHESNEDRRAVMDSYYKKMLAEIVGSGGGYMLETEGYEYIYDQNTGTVKGVKARNTVTGQEYIINAKAVISSTGGFGGSEEMMNQLLDKRWAGKWKQNGMLQNDGKMIKAALKIGAGTWNIDMSPITMEIGLPQFLHHFPINFVEGKITARTGRKATWTYNDIPLYMCVSADSFAVDSKGARFGNEWGIGNNIGDQVPPISWKVGPYFYSVWSKDQVDVLAQKGFFNVFRTAAYCQQGGFPLEKPTPQVYEALDASVKEGIAWKADTLEELAKKTGMDAATLAKSVQTYNGYCDAGVDQEFNKDPKFLTKVGSGPYYAIKAMPVMYGTGGGLNIDTQIRVLKQDGVTPINGLYATGQDSFGVLMSNEKNYLGFGGICQGWGATSGRLAGKNAAEYAFKLAQ